MYIDENLEVNGLITENEKRLAKLRSDPIFNNVTNKTSKFDYYLEFDQSSNTQEVVVSNHSDLQLETFTIIIDFKYTGGSFSNFRYLFSSASNYGVRISEDFRIQAGFGYNSNEEMITSYNQIEEDKWHQAVFTFDPNKDPEMVIYIDGILDTTKQTNNTPDLDADDRVIGHVPDTLKGITGLDGFYGKIANVKLLDESLDEEEVKELYYNPDKILGSEVSYWNLNEGMFDTANDVISGHNGTIQNAEWGGGVKENLIVKNDINVGGTIYADGDEVAIDGDEQPPEAHSSTHEAGGSDPIETLPVSAIKIVPSDNWRHKDDTSVVAGSGENDWELQKFFTMDTDMGDVRTLINLRTTKSDYTAYAVLTVNGEPDNNPDWQSSTYSTDQTDFQTFEKDVGVTLEEGDELQLYLKTDTPSDDIGNAMSDNFYIGYSWDFKRYVTLTAK